MRVALDATPLILSSGGLVRYTAELSLALARNFPEDNFILLSDQPFTMPPGHPPNLHRGGAPKNALERRWWLWGVNREMRRRLGFVPENPAPYEYLTGREFLSLAASLGEVPRHEIRTRVDEVLAAVNMEKAGNLRIRRYSKGMIQRIAIGQALVHRPELLILDEPTSGLDPLGRKLVRDLILSERRRGTTILFSSHIISDVEAVCERVAVLVGGKLVRAGSVSELLTTQVPVAEVVVEGLSAEVVRALPTPLHQLEALDGRLRVRLADDQVNQFIGAVIAQGGRVRQLQPERFSLEDMFLSALEEAGPRGTVGGEISE